MKEFFEVNCPDCKTVLIVRRKDGKVVEVRKPILEDTTGNRFEDAIKKVKGEKDVINQKFAEATERERNKVDRLNALFDENLKKAREDKSPEKPPSPFDHE